MDDDLFDLYEERAEYCAIRDGIIGSRFVPMASGVSRETALKMLDYWRISRGDDDDAFVRVVRHGDPVWRSVSLAPPVEAKPVEASEHDAVADGEDIPF